MSLHILKQIAQLFGERGVLWGLGGSLMLSLRGLVEKANDIDLVVAESDIERAHELLLTLGTGARYGAKHPNYSRYFYKHMISGVSVDVIGGYEIQHEQGMYEVPFDEMSIPDCTVLDGVQVPLMSLEDWFVIYSLIGREEKRQMLHHHLQKVGVAHPALLRRAAQGNLPERLRAQVETLLAIRRLDITDEETAARVLAIQIPAYRVEAELIGFDGIPPLHDTLEKLRGCGETFYGYFVGAELAGAIAYKRDGDVLDIHRMMVHPKHFRKGIATHLLQHLFAVEESVHKTLVSTGTKNQPAIDLYLRNGFQEVRVWEVAPGVSITFFEKA